jgi:beta-mannosidase
MSEYGFQSFPQIETVNTYTLAGDHDIQSPVMMAHQKHPRGNQLIREYMLRDYNEPKDFETFLYMSQVLQAEGIKVGAEHLRRAMPRNMGSMYWQINDCWPVASWSSIDYYGRWKALQYYSKRFYQEILVSPHEEDGNINVYVVSDRQKSLQAKLTVTLMDFNGRVLTEKSLPVEVKPLDSVVYLKLPKSELLAGHDTKSMFLNCDLSVDGSTISSNRMFFEPFKNLSIGKADIKLQTAPGAKGFKVTLQSDKLAKGVYLSTGKDDGFFVDNYFDILPGKTVTVEFQPKEKITIEEFRKSLKVRSL